MKIFQTHSWNNVSYIVKSRLAAEPRPFHSTICINQYFRTLILSKAPKMYLYSGRLYHPPVIQPDIWIICSNSKQLRTLGINSETLCFSISTQMIKQVHQHIVNFPGAGMWHSKIKLPEEKHMFIKKKTAVVLQTHAGKKTKKISNFVSIISTVTFTQFGRLLLTFWSNLLPQRVATLRMKECFSEMLEPINQITQHYTPRPCLTPWLSS